MIKGRTFPEVKVTTKIKKNGSYSEPKELYKKTSSNNNSSKSKDKKEDLSVSEAIARKLNKKFAKKD